MNTSFKQNNIDHKLAHAPQETASGFRTKAALIVAAAAFVAGLSACAGKDKVTATEPGAQTETVANRAAREVEAPYFVDVEFQKGSNALTEQSRSAIASLINRAKAEGELNDVKVLSWADEEYPSASRKKLGKTQRNLAKSRNRSIEDYVKSLNHDVGIDAHNMAERPSAVSRWFNTPDARFKRALVAAGLPTTSDAAPITGRASHAVILVTLK